MLWCILLMWFILEFVIYFCFCDETMYCGCTTTALATLVRWWCCWLLKCQCLHSTKSVLAGCLLWKESNQFSVISMLFPLLGRCDPSRIGSLQRRHVMSVVNQATLFVWLWSATIIYITTPGACSPPTPDQRVTGICTCLCIVNFINKSWYRNTKLEHPIEQIINTMHQYNAISL